MTAVSTPGPTTATRGSFTYTPFAALVFAAGIALPFTALTGLVTGTSVLALAATVSIVAATWAVFAAWPHVWSAKSGLLHGGLIGYAPASAWAYGDNPAYAEYHWHGVQLLAGNLELLAGLALFAVALAAAFVPRPPPTM